MDTAISIQDPVRVQDYILDVTKEKTKPVEYAVVLQNNSDFVISRKTQKSERELVILISQGLYYIRDKKTNAIESITLQNLKSFLRDLKDNLALEQVAWIPFLSKEHAEFIESVISDDVLVDMCRHNVLRNASNPSWYRPYWQKNSKLFMQICDLFPSIAESGKFMSSIPFVYELHDTFGYNEAMYFVQQFVKSGIQKFETSSYSSYYGTNEFIGLMKKEEYNLNLRRFIDFLLFDLYSQGIATIDRHFFNEYGDFLSMQLKFYGKIAEKYPKNFKTMHDVVTLKFNELKATEQCQNFNEHVREIAELDYTGREYCIRAAREPQELVEEGIALSHCVKDYIGRVANGECHILFLRKTAFPNESLVTVQLSGKVICQAQGLKRRPITSEERKFLSRWTQLKKLEFQV